MRRLLISAMIATTGLTALPAGAQDRAFNQTGDSWYAHGQRTLQERLARKPIDTRAKNVILFIGDGMGPTTVTAARIYAGQKQGKNGEEHELTFESLPHLALAKTYNDNAQTPDSAGTASAMVTGVKTKQGVLSISKDVAFADCEAALAKPMITVAELAELSGMATGVVSTTRITHATPAAAYAHTPHRNWEDDTELPEGVACKDIARQLIEFPYGDGLEVALGGGRRHFLRADQEDPEDKGATGNRKDGRDLTAEWATKSDAHAYVWNQAQFDAIDPATDPRVLGLFERSHMKYDLDRGADTGGEPSLAEMTGKAIDILSRNENGYFLMVEGGRIDHAHHATNAARALDETRAYDAAVQVALEKTDETDTLIIVTADHGHNVTMQGYARRGNPILGLVQRNNRDGSPSETLMLAQDGKPFPVVSYANGPGSVLRPGIDFSKGRPDLSKIDTTDPNFIQHALVPLGSETHGGQDVGIYARGPKAYLFDGTVEQNYVFHVMEHALDLKNRAGIK